MSKPYESLVRKILFTQEAEKIHEYAVMSLRTLGCVAPVCRFMESFNRLHGANPIDLFGLKFPNMVGLAAGFDKNGECMRAMSGFGFGHLEIGTVTRQKQPGNPRPRLFRYPEHGAIINRMGFNNEGAEAMAARLAKYPMPGKRRIPIGVNIGKTKIVPLEQAVADYVESFNLLADYADYFAINVSSPNTPDLRKLQGGDYLPELLGTLMRINRERARKMGTQPIPILLKIAPDLSFREIDTVVETLMAQELNGIIATNTTIQRPGGLANAEEAGGLSGNPLHLKSLEVVNYISRSTEGKLPIIGVGGIDSPESAGRMVDAGASLVQVYSGMIYKGPFTARDIARGLAWRHSDWI